MLEFFSFSPTLGSLRFLVALFTVTPSPMDVCIVFIEQMSSAALRFASVMLITGLNGWPVAYAPAHVFKMRYRLRVMWIYAKAHAAKMVWFQTFRYRADVKFAGESVRLNESHSIPEFWISVAIHRAEPKPTSTIRLRNDEIQKTFNRGKLESWHCDPPKIAILQAPNGADTLFGAVPIIRGICG